jgi:hypothetical protein
MFGTVLEGNIQLRMAASLLQVNHKGLEFNARLTKQLITKKLTRCSELDVATTHPGMFSPVCNFTKLRREHELASKTQLLLNGLNTRAI